MNKFTKFGKYVEVYDSRKDKFTDNPGVSVSWSSIGSVSPDEASKFAKDLLEAIKFANKLEAEVIERS